MKWASFVTSILLSFSDVVTDDINGVIGTTITLTCNLSPSASKVIWKGPYDRSTIYAQSRHLNDNLPKNLLNRIFTITDGEGKVHLRIVNVQYADQGKYVCSVDETEQEKNLFLPTLLYSTEPSYYRSLLMDPDTMNLIVGSMNSVAVIDILSPDRYTVQTTSISFPPQQNDYNYCILSKTEKPFCQNHIKLISKKSKDVLFLCGTNADSPKGFELNLSNSSQSMIGSVPCPNDPFSNFTAVYSTTPDSVNKNYIYFGAQSGGDSAISRQIYNSDGTVRDDLKGVISNTWMNEPQFAGSFDIGEKVYFFFRELAGEVDPAERQIYSRVAKVCKDDTGGNSLLRSKWTSFQKARLNCSIPGDFPVYFDALQDIVTKDNEVFYGLFTSRKGLPASAICAFHLTDIENALDGPFKEQSNANTYWTEATGVPSLRPGQCTNESLSLPNDVLQFIVDHPLMHQSVQPLYGKPIFVLDDEELQQIEIHSNITELVFYVGSNKGIIYKLFSKNDTTYISSNYSVGAADDIIWSLKQHGDYVYVGTDMYVREMNVVNCEQYRWIDSCVRDPHCAWINTTDYLNDLNDEDEIQCYNRCRLLSFVIENNLLNKGKSYTHNNVNLSKTIPYSCPPSKPKHLQVTYTSVSSLSLRWIAGFDGGFQPKFILEYRLYQSRTWTMYTVEQTGSDDDPQSLQLPHLNAGSLYEIKMSATNDVGSSSTTDVIVVGKGQSITENNNKLWIAVVVTLSVILVVQQMFIVMLCHKRYPKYRGNKDESIKRICSQLDMKISSATVVPGNGCGMKDGNIKRMSPTSATDVTVNEYEESEKQMVTHKENVPANVLDLNNGSNGNQAINKDERVKRMKKKAKKSHQDDNSNQDNDYDQTSSKVRRKKKKKKKQPDDNLDPDMQDNTDSAVKPKKDKENKMKIGDDLNPYMQRYPIKEGYPHFIDESMW